MSSHALVRGKELNGSGEETLTEGVDGDGEFISVMVSSSVVTEGVVSVCIAKGVGVMSSAKTRVALD